MGFALDQSGALMGVGHMRHELRVTEPTIGDNQGCREVETASSTRRQGLIEHDLSPVQLGATASSRSFGAGSSPLKVDGHDQFIN